MIQAINFDTPPKKKGINTSKLDSSSFIISLHVDTNFNFLKFLRNNETVANTFIRHKKKKKELYNQFVPQITV